ncbi:unnamed protein product [Rhizophagus irregularis]|nr:unnamed protein product [Rhizophagus irregularis]
MSNVHTLKDISDDPCLDDGGPKVGSILGEPPHKRYPPSRAELIEQLSRVKNDRKVAISCGNRIADRCELLSQENRRVLEELNRSQKENECLQGSLNQTKKDIATLSKESERMQDKINQYTSLFKQLTGCNTELKSLIVSERKSHAELDAKYLEEIKSLKLELENEQELSERNLKSKDSFISCLWGYLRGQQAEMELLHFKHSASRCGSPQLHEEASHDSSVKGGETSRRNDDSEEEEPEAESTVPADSEVLPPIAVLGAGKVLANDYSVFPPLFKLTIFILLAMLIIWYAYKCIFRSKPTDEKEELIYPHYRIPLGIRHKNERAYAKDETLPYRY